MDEDFHTLRPEEQVGAIHGEPERRCHRFDYLTDTRFAGQYDDNRFFRRRGNPPRHRRAKCKRVALSAVIGCLYAPRLPSFFCLLIPVRLLVFVELELLAGFLAVMRRIVFVLKGLLLPANRVGEVGGLGIRSSQGGEVVESFPVTQFAGPLGQLDGLLAIAELRRRTDGQEPGFGIQSVAVLGIELYGLFIVSKRFVKFLLSLPGVATIEENISVSRSETNGFPNVLDGLVVIPIASSGPRPVVDRLEVRGVKADGFAVIADGLVIILLAVPGQAPVVDSVSVRRAELQRFRCSPRWPCRTLA